MLMYNRILAMKDHDTVKVNWNINKGRWQSQVYETRRHIVRQTFVDTIFVLYARNAHMIVHL